MSIYKVILGLMFWLVCSLSMQAQECKGFYKSGRCFVRDSKEFKQYGQARSAAVEVGETYKLKAVLYGQKDYVVSVCADQGFKPLHFRIVNSDNNEVIYDNTDDDYNQFIGFSIDKTKNVNIELTILTQKEGNKDPMKGRVCVGVQIVWRKIPRLGFGPESDDAKEETEAAETKSDK